MVRKHSEHIFQSKLKASDLKIELEIMLRFGRRSKSVKKKKKKKKPMTCKKSLRGSLKPHTNAK